MQLITTYTVIDKVVDELDLFCTIEELKWGSGKSYKIKKTYLDILDPVFRKKNKEKFIVPKQFEIILADTLLVSSGQFIIKKEKDNNYLLLDALDNKLITKSQLAINYKTISDTLLNGVQYPEISTLSYKDFSIRINWEDAPINSELVINLNDYNKSVLKTQRNTKVGREGKTDLFNIVYSASSASQRLLLLIRL